LFYEEEAPFGYMSNFYQSPIDLDGKMWPSTEHYFQAMKYEGTEHEETVRNAPTCMDAKNLG
jgi:predicted NAD-dependent protein-ADP-ribosyltransferase YbiA (DUF1768 family)